MLLEVIKKGYTSDQIFNFDKISIDNKHMSQRTYFQRQRNMLQNLRLQRRADVYKPLPLLHSNSCAGSLLLVISQSKLQVFLKVNSHIYLCTKLLFTKFLPFDVCVTNKV